MFDRALVPALALFLALNVSSSAAAKTQTIRSTDKKGQTHQAVGYVPMKAAPNAKTFKAPPIIASKDLPPKVDLRGKLTPVEDQGQTSSCVANAIAGAYEYWIKRTSGQEYDTSRLFIYYNARWRNGDQNEDSGSIIQLAMEGLQNFGSCAEKDWPFQQELLLKKPNRQAYQEASSAKVKEMQQVPLDLQAWKEALASGLPVVFGCLLFESFDDCNRNGGVVPMPDPSEMARESHGGHAMCAVGYSDREKVFIVRNSWGDQWGDAGYCYMPYNYLLNPKLNGGDCWVFIPQTPIPDPEDSWFMDDEPVTDGGRGVDFDVNPYDLDDYADVEVLWWDEQTEDYSDDYDDEYLTYVEYVEEEDWDEIADYSIEEAVEAEDNDDLEDEEDIEDDGEYDDEDEYSDDEDDAEYDDEDEYSAEDDEEYDDEDEGYSDDEDDAEYDDEDEYSDDDDEEYDDDGGDYGDDDE